jgi:hypothetical protein
MSSVITNLFQANGKTKSKSKHGKPKANEENTVLWHADYEEL